MVTFVEQAVLQVKDKSTAPVRKINQEIIKLLKNARKLNGLRITINGMAKAQRDVRDLNSAMSKIRSKTFTVKANTKGATSAINKLARNRTVRVTAKVNASQARNVLNNLARNRTARINATATGTPGGPSQTSAAAAFRLDTGRLGSILNDSWRRLGMTIEHAIIKGFSDATIQRDVAGSSLDILGLNKADTLKSENAITQINATQTQFDEGQIRGLFAENLRVTRGNIDEAISLTKSAADLAAFQILQGASPSEAIDQSFSFAKAGEQSGAFTDEDGRFTQESVDEFFSIMKQNIAGGGQEITAQLVRTLFKSLRTAKFALDERGITAALILAEEQGSTAGVGINQAIKQLSGQGQAKFRIERLRELGLLDAGEEVKVGTRVDAETGQTFDVFETRMADAVDNAFLRADPAGWVAKHLIPALELDGIDTSDEAQVVKAVNDLVGRATANEAVTALILRNQEIQSQTDFNLGIDTSPEAVTRVEDQSLTTSLANARSGFTDALGAAGESLESVFIPALNKVGSIADTIASFIEGPDGEGSAARTGAALAGGGLAIGATVATGSALLKGLGLRGSAVALTSSAAHLSAAALALQGAAASGGVAGGGKGGKPAPSAKGSAKGGGKGSAIVAALSFMSRLAPLLSMSSLSGSTPQVEGEGNTEETRKALSDMFAAKEARDRDQSGRDAAMSMPVVSFLTDDTALLLSDLKTVLREMVVAEDSSLTGQLPALTQERDELVEMLADSGISGDALKDVFGAGIDGVTRVGDDLSATATEFGPMAGQGLLAMAPQIGQVMGTAALSILTGTTLNIGGGDRTPVPRLSDTGASTPF